MNQGTLLRFYHSLPPQFRSLVAGIKGRQLRAWRYGPQTAQLMEEAVERERWNEQEWGRWREEKLSHLLHRAATKVPYYRELWSARRRRGDTRSWEYLDNWPVLTKEPLRQNPHAFVANDCNVRRMNFEQTSGTTGTPLGLWMSRDAIQSWFALFEVRARQWNGVSRHENWATVGGQLVVPPNARNPPFWVWSAPTKQLYLSANHISARTIPAYVDALNRRRITHLVAYSSAAAALARGALEGGLQIETLRVVVTLAEPLLSWQREVLTQGFGCQVRESYGMSEMVAAATECSAGTLHLWPEVGHVEVLVDSEDVAVSDGNAGRVVATGLLNPDMPLIRYNVGDRAALRMSENRCACGRLLPALVSVEGRNDDVLQTMDGRLIGRLDPVFKSDLPIREAQIIQETLSSFRILYVPAAGFTANSARTIIERLQARLGPVEVVMEPVSHIPRGANGKFRAVISRLASDSRLYEAARNLSTAKSLVSATER